MRPFFSLASTGLGSLTRRISRDTGALFLRSTLLGATDAIPGQAQRHGSRAAQSTSKRARAVEKKIV